MEWLEKNIEAYRILAAILGDLRTVVRDRLVGIYGEDWHNTGIPDATLARVVERKEREMSIDWYESEYQELIDFASFAEVLQIVEANPDVLPALAQLAPSPELLHARFLELEVLRAKLGMTRPISETELSFLKTFHVRFRKAIEAAASAAGEAPAAPPKPKPETAPEVDPEPVETPAEEPEPIEVVTEGDSLEAARGSFGDQRQGDLGTRPIPVMSPDQPAAEAEATPDESEQMPAVDEEFAPLAPVEDMVAMEEPQLEEEEEPEEEAAAAEPETWEPPTLETALAENDHRSVLRELYKEVTSLAEGIWSGDVPPVPVIWEQVCVSDWYERNFSRLGLQPVSDFYSIITEVRQRLANGASRPDLQEYLKSANFAQTLLSLRNMFQKNQI